MSVLYNHKNLTIQYTVNKFANKIIVHENAFYFFFNEKPAELMNKDYALIQFFDCHGSPALENLFTLHLSFYISEWSFCKET